MAMLFECSLLAEHAFKPIIQIHKFWIVENFFMSHDVVLLNIPLVS